MDGGSAENAGAVFGRARSNLLTSARSPFGHDLEKLLAVPAPRAGVERQHPTSNPFGAIRFAHCTLQTTAFEVVWI